MFQTTIQLGSGDWYGPSIMKAVANGRATTKPFINQWEFGTSMAFGELEDLCWWMTI